MKLILIVLFMIVIGFFLLAASSMITKSSPNVTLSNKLSKANQGIFTMGVVFIVLGAALAACDYGCGCGELLLGSSVMMSFFILLGITLTTLGAIVMNSIKVESGKRWSIYVMVTGIVFIVICSGMFFMEHSEKIKSGLSNVINRNKMSKPPALPVHESPGTGTSPGKSPGTSPGSLAFRYHNPKKHTFRCY